MKPNKIFTAALFTIYLLLLAGIILFKLPFYSSEISDGVRVINLVPFAGSFDENGNLLLREIRDNILIFIPFGIYLSMLNDRRPLIRKVLTIVALTLAFEILQFIFAMGRSDITDVLDNTLGGLIGVGIYAVMFKIFKGKTDMVVNITALIVTVLVSARFGQLFYLSHFAMRGHSPQM